MKACAQRHALSSHQSSPGHVPARHSNSSHQVCSSIRVGGRRGAICHAQGPGGSPSESGDTKLQEQLVDMLQLEVAKAKVREDIQADLEQRKEGIKQIGEELLKDMEKKLELDRMRMELASSSSLADTLAQFQELEDEVQGIRDQLQADQQDLAAFEARSASLQNNGLFFKQLYQAPDNPNLKDDATAAYNQGGWRSQKNSSSTLDPQVVQKLASDIQAPAVREVHSPLRLYVFSYMSVVLMLLAATDVGSGEVSPGQDLLYLGLAVGLGWQAWNERQALTRVLDQEERGGGAGGRGRQ